MGHVKIGLLDCFGLGLCWFFDCRWPRNDS